MTGDDVDPVFLFTAAEAAPFLGVKPATIRTWRARGHITPKGEDMKGRPLYDGLELLEVERKLRDHARRA